MPTEDDKANDGSSSTRTTLSVNALKAIASVPFVIRQPTVQCERGSDLYTFVSSARRRHMGGSSSRLAFTKRQIADVVRAAASSIPYANVLIRTASFPRVKITSSSSPNNWLSTLAKIAKYEDVLVIGFYAIGIYGYEGDVVDEYCEACDFWTNEDGSCNQCAGVVVDDPDVLLEYI